MEKKPKGKQPNRWLQLINIPIQMGTIIFLFVYLGQWLDVEYQKTNALFTKVLVIFGVFIALGNTIRQVNQINKNEK